MTKEFEDMGELLLPVDAAAFLGVPEGTLENWRYREMGPPFVKVGGRVRYPFKWLRRYLLDSTVCPGGCPDEKQKRGAAEVPLPEELQEATAPASPFSPQHPKSKGGTPHASHQ